MKVSNGPILTSFGLSINLFAFTESEVLYKKSFEIEDQVIPSSNSVIANNLYELYNVTYNKKYLEIMDKMMRKVGSKAQNGYLIILIG